MASACEKCHYFLCRCGDHEELIALRTENEKLKENLETIKEQFRHYARDHGDDFNEIV